MPDLAPVARSDFPDLRRPVVGPIATVVGVLAWLALVIPALPSWAKVSPVWAAGTAVGVPAVGIVALSVLLVPVLLAVLMWVGRTSLLQVLFEAALSEELMFRAGCQTWTPLQRLRSNVQFGFAHLTNLVLSTVGLGVLAGVGWIFQRVYLAEFARSGDERRAVAAAAHFHARYNLTLLTITVTVVVLVVGELAGLIP